MRSMASTAIGTKASAAGTGRIALTPSGVGSMLWLMEAKTSFWTDARRELAARTLANLFLLLIGASATGEVIGTFPWWLKTLIAAGIVLAGALAVIVMPERKKEA